MSGPLPTVLVVEDEREMRRFIHASLTSHQLKVIEAEDAEEAVMMITSHNPELILLDLGLPDADGIDLTRRLREWCHTPIIVLSARGREDEKVTALDAGADDYLTKPFGVNELLARLRVALRHRGAAGDTVKQYEFGGLHIDLVRRIVKRDGQEVHLTPTEYKLLTYFAQNVGKVLTHRQILSAVWGPAYAGHTHYVRVHMAELRKKVELQPARPRLLVTESGLGYRLRDDAG